MPPGFLGSTTIERLIVRRRFDHRKI